ncbi:YjgP/YjgQ family permease [bacterium]|nr:YjgP/YjgQ family permease [bacterium]
MKILQRYVLREILAPTLLALFTLTFVLLIQMVFTQAGEISGSISFSLLLRLIGYVLPTLLVLTIPMSILTGVLLGMGRMTVDSEVKAFRTHGVNLFRLFVPVLALGILACGFVFFFSLHFAPMMLQRSMSLIERLQYELITSLEPGRFEDRLSSHGTGMVLYFEDKDPDTGQMENIYLSLEGGPGQLRESLGGNGEAKLVCLAQSGEISLNFNPDDPSPETRTATLILEKGTLHFLRGREDPNYVVLEPQTLRVEFELNEEDPSRRGLMPTLTLGELARQIREESSSAGYERTTFTLPLVNWIISRRVERPVFNEKGQREWDKDAQYMRAELWQRVSISLASFAFVLIALPLAIYIKPSGKSVGVMVAFLLLMAYYGLMHWGVVVMRQTVGNGPLFGPYLILLPNLVLTLLGAVLLYRTVRR